MWVWNGDIAENMGPIPSWLFQEAEGFTYNPTGYKHYKSHFPSRINFLLNGNALSQMDLFQEEARAGTGLKWKIIEFVCSELE